MHRGQIIHQKVCRIDHPGKDLGAQSHAGEHPKQACRHGIQQELPRHRSTTVAQRLQRTNLRALLLHHTGHGGQAHQTCYQDKEDGKYTGNGIHPVCILPKAVIAHIVGTIHHIPLDLLADGVQLRL